MRPLASKRRPHGRRRRFRYNGCPVGDVALASKTTAAPPLLYTRHANQYALPTDRPFPPAVGFCVAAAAADFLAAGRGPPHPVPGGAVLRPRRAVAAPERAAARPAARDSRATRAVRRG